MAAHEIDIVMTKKYNWEGIFAENSHILLLPRPISPVSPYRYDRKVKNSTTQQRRTPAILESPEYNSLLVLK